MLNLMPNLGSQRANAACPKMSQNVPLRPMHFVSDVQWHAKNAAFERFACPNALTPGTFAQSENGNG